MHQTPKDCCEKRWTSCWTSYKIHKNDLDLATWDSRWI